MIHWTDGPINCLLNNESTQNLQLFKTYSLHEVLHSLTKNQSILEFYQGLDMIYILLMQTNKLDIKAIPRSKDLDEQIQYYHLALTAPIHTDYSFNPRALDSLYQVSATRLFKCSSAIGSRFYAVKS